MNMWLARNKDGTLILSFEYPERSWVWTDWKCEEKKEFWTLPHNPKINISNMNNYPEHQLIKLPNSDMYPYLKWEDDPIKVHLEISYL